MTQKNKRTQRKYLLVRLVALFFALLMLVFVLVALLPSCAPPPGPSPTPSPTAMPTASLLPSPAPTPLATPTGLIDEGIPAAAQTEYVEPAQGGLIALPLPDEARITALIAALSIPRPLGSAEEAQTADFIAKQLEILGFAVSRQELNEGNTKFSREALYLSLTVGTEPVTELKAVEGGANGQGTAQLVFFDDNSSLSTDISGKVLLMPDNGDLFSILQLTHAGQIPAAVLVYPVETPAGSPRRFEADGTYPVMEVTSRFAGAVKRKLAEGAVEASYFAAYAVNTFRSYNIEAPLLPESGKSDAPLYILCAHYDGEYCTPGANDNASGVAALLETARLMKDIRPDAEMRFVFFTGEEDGAIGSKYYVQNLSDSDKKRIAGVVNLDMIASKNGGAIKVYTLDGKTNAVADRFALALNKYFPGKPLPEMDAQGRSDHVPFQKAGVPAIMLSQIEVPGEYRTDKDTPSIISMERIKEAVSWIVAFIACEPAAK